MKKPLLLGVAGVLVGVGVAFGVFFFVLGGNKTAEAAAHADPTPIAFGGKLGPHITLQDRVFNLQGSGTPVYLKVQTVIEFETHEEPWAKFAKTCVAAIPAVRSDAMVSTDPLALPVVRVAPEEGAAVSPCVAMETKLLHEFDEEIGTGRQLIEDAITSIITRHTVAELSKPEGKEALKKEIKDAVAHLIHEPKVTRVLFTNFITQ